MKMWRILTLSIALVSIVAPLVAGFTTWVVPATRTGVLRAGASCGCLAVILYFNWRARLKSQILADDRRDDKLVRTA